DGMDTPMTVLSCAKPVATRAARAMTMVNLRSMRFLLLVRARPRPGRAPSGEGVRSRGKACTFEREACDPDARTRARPRRARGQAMVVVPWHAGRGVRCLPS